MQIHPSQVQPAQNFDVVYFLGDHTDNSTYYVRAVMYDVRTGDVLLTENLSQSPNNSRLFAATIQAPPDPIGYGRNIVVIVTVYTDSGYSDKSQNYQELSYNFLVKAEQMILGGGGVDYDTIQKMIDAAFERFVGKIPPVEPGEPLPEMPFARILLGLTDVKAAIANIPTPNLDLSPILSKLEALLAAIKMLRQDIPDPVDLAPVLSSIDDLEKSVSAAIEELREGQNKTDKLLKSMERVPDVLAKKTEGELSKLVKNVNVHITMPSPAPDEKKKEGPIPFSLRQLTG